MGFLPNSLHHTIKPISLFFLFLLEGIIINPYFWIWLIFSVRVLHRLIPIYGSNAPVKEG